MSDFKKLFLDGPIRPLERCEWRAGDDSDMDVLERLAPQIARVARALATSTATRELTGMFVWQRTPQGHDYWQEIHLLINDNVDWPPIKVENELFRIYQSCDTARLWNTDFGDQEI